MDSRNRIQRGARLLALGIIGLAPGLASAATPTSGPASDDWQFSASVYGWFAGIGGNVNVPATGANADFNVDANTLINNLNLVGMAAFDVHKGRWGMFTDVVYMDLSASKSNTRDFTLGNIGIPATATADLHLDVKTTIWTIAGEYRVLDDQGWTVDLLAGARYLSLQQTLDWSITGSLGPLPPANTTGSSERSGDIWDGIVGVRGRFAFGEGQKWTIPFYLDGGTGDSENTYQAALGVGYSFEWGQISAMWRYLDYKPQSGRLQDVNFSGPMIGATFRW